MKFTSETLRVLKNFSQINPSIVIREGSTLWTEAPGTTIFAKANVVETFPKRIGVYSLSKFLNVIGLFKEDEVEVEFTDTHAVVSSGRKKVDYTLGEESLINAGHDHDPKMPEPVATFDLDYAEFSSAMKAMSVLGLTEMEFSGDGSKVRLRAVDPKNSAKDVYSVEVADTDKKFSSRVQRESLKLLEVDKYVVGVHELYVKFESPAVTYWIAASANKAG